MKVGDGVGLGISGGQVSSSLVNIGPVFLINDNWFDWLAIIAHLGRSVISCEYVDCKGESTNCN